ncbi:MAG: uL15m family ribosomal protein [Thermoplasmata archaeon]
MGRTSKLRGKRTHGKGKKAGRGAGKRGGRGKAGLHKHKYMTAVKMKDPYFGDYGFKRHPSLVVRKNTINLSEVEERLDEIILEGFAEKSKNIVRVDLEKMGIDKLLGRGQIRTKMKILVGEATDSAIEKVQKAGGDVIIPGTKEAER